MYLVIAAMLTSVASLFLSARGNYRDTDEPLARSECGYLSGGPRRAVQAAVVALLDLGALRITSRGALTRDGRLPAGMPPLERALYNQAHTPIGMAALRQAPKVSLALRGLRSSLVARGLVLPRWRSNMALAALALALVVVVVRLVASPPSDRLLLDVVVGFTLLVLLVAMVLWSWRREHVTGAAHRLLRNMRSQHPRPERGSKKAVVTGEAAISVALYGIWTATAMGTEHGAMRSVLSESFFGDSGQSDSGGSDSGGY